jgi:hypothetical protein
MHTLEQIYQRLNAGTDAAKMTSFTEPATGPGTGTMHTLDDIMGIAPAVDNTAGALPAEVLAGKTFWSLRTDGTWGMQTGTGAPAPVPQTGQIGCWNDAGTAIDCTGTGQDGEYRKVVAWPNPRFTDNGNGTVTDNLTGLIWLKDASCPILSGYTNFLDWANKLHDGCTDCGGTDDDCSLSDGSAAGDWRLPNIHELLSLVHWDLHGPAVPNTAGTGQWTEGNPFSDVESSWYLSSTTVPNTRAFAWLVNMDSGLVGSGAKIGSRNAWAVRDGQ